VLWLRRGDGAKEDEDDMSTSKTPATIASDAILAHLGAHYDAPDGVDAGALLASFTTIIARACADACAEERERVARLFDKLARDCFARACGYDSWRRQGQEHEGTAARIRASGETPGTTSTPAQPPPAEDRFIRAYIDGDHELRLGAHVREAIARVVAAVRAEAPQRTAAAERADVVAARLDGFRRGFDWVEAMVDAQRISDRTEYGWDTLAQWLNEERQRETVPGDDESPVHPLDRERGDHVGAAAKGGE
jgi:hypothetical protein